MDCGVKKREHEDTMWVWHAVGYSAASGALQLWLYESKG